MEIAKRSSIKKLKMIDITKISEEAPYQLFTANYLEAEKRNQSNIEAISISSYNKANAEVESRFVNLKFIDNDEWIFFSNYNSPKSVSFDTHEQISGLFFWNSINTQIRVKAMIHKTSRAFNNNYFITRSNEKNALAISSDQSMIIDTFDSVKKNYNKSLESDNLNKCPKYWGGYIFIPYYFEFWKGHESRLNKRDVYKSKGGNWEHFIIQP